jgi:hypothetical protein
MSRLVRTVLPTALLALLAACDPEAELAPSPPTAEFVVAAGDSSFWVTSGPAGLALRRAPLTLARVNGRFYELYVTDADRSFYDAVFVSQRLWRRDLLSNDSSVVFEDATVERLATDYGHRHPDAEPLGVDDEEAEYPVVTATSDVVVVDVMGPYVTVESFADHHPEDGLEVHEVRRGVVDLRSGRPVTLAALFGDSASARVRAAGRTALDVMFDSVLARRDAQGRRAQRALRGFSFDERSFALTRMDQHPGVAFLVPGHGREAGGLSVPLPPIAAPQGAWWAQARHELPEPGERAQEDRWAGGGYEVLARYDRGEEQLDLVLSAGREQWAVGRLPAPASRIFWLDSPPVDPTTRRALARAFDEAQLYGEDVRQASAPSERSAPAAVATLVARSTSPLTSRAPISAP